jgi:hypothetical protein
MAPIKREMDATFPNKDFIPKLRSDEFLCRYGPKYNGTGKDKGLPRLRATEEL